MKRSEAIKRIAEEIQNWMSRNPDETEANLILNLVEDMGMLPPDYFVDGWDCTFDEPVKIRRRNSWQPEDDSK